MKQIIMAALGATLFACNGTPQDRSTTSIPYGLWVWSADVPENEFELKIERERDEWRAQINGSLAPVTVSGDEFLISGLSGQEFKGTLSNDGKLITGYWHQPSSDLAYSRMVTEVNLDQTVQGVWSANFTSQARPFHMFLDIFEDSSGEPKAVLRNPERNEILASMFDMEEDGDGDFTLVAGEGEWQLRQSLDLIQPGQLKLEHRWFEDPVYLRQATDADTASYFSRPKTDDPSPYTVPELLEDGWKIGTPESEGYDRDRLNALIAELASADPRNRRPSMIHSLLVAHKGKLVVEEYFHGYTRDTPHDTRSLAKVFGPVLMGAMRHQGIDIDSGETPIEGILAEVGETPDDPRKKEVTLGHLMSYSSGLDCIESSSKSAGNEDNLWNQTGEPNFWRYIARVEQLHDPGTRYAYCSGSINMVASRLTEKSGLPLYAAFDKYVAEPLGFGRYHWNLAPNGEGYMGGGVYVRPRDILKIGAMYLADGSWNGVQITSPEWIDESTSPKIDISPETTGLSQDEFSNNYFGGQQAYVWRVDTVSANGKSYASHEATGNGGQILLVVPELELTAVFTGGNYRWGSIWGRWRNDIIGGHIIPALNLE